jgi:DNA-binding transcriptional ArsR family regulator
MKFLNTGEKPTFNIPTKPKVKLKPAPPDQRQIAVMPLRALKDRSLDNASIRVLGLLCSYCNRAGITWVGHERLAKDLGVSRTAITRQLVALRKKNYIKTLVQGGKLSHTSTTRVIFNEDIDTADAIGAVSDECRSPSMIDREIESMSTVPLKATKKARKTIKLPVKAEALQVIEKAMGDVLVTHNKVEGIVQEVYRTVFLKDKLINDLDLKGFEWIAMAETTDVELRECLELWLRARNGEPESIIEFSKALCQGR